MVKTPQTTLTETLKVGDNVYLKSGSPKMCVEAILTDNKVQVVWSQYEAQTIDRTTLHIDTIRRAD